MCLRASCIGVLFVVGTPGGPNNVVLDGDGDVNKNKSKTKTFVLDQYLNFIKCLSNQCSVWLGSRVVSVPD